MEKHILAGYNCAKIWQLVIPAFAGMTDAVAHLRRIYFMLALMRVGQQRGSFA